MLVPTFSNIGDLKKYLESSNGQNLVLSSKGMQSLLMSEANRLKNCIQKRLDEYYNSYQPNRYERTDALKKALRVDDNVKVSFNNTMFSVKINFDEASVEADSLFSDTTYNKAALINYGWQVKKDVWFKDIEHFGWQRGFHFIEKGIDDFNQTNPYGIKVMIVRKH